MVETTSGAATGEGSHLSARAMSGTWHRTWLFWARGEVELGCLERGLGLGLHEMRRQVAAPDDEERDQDAGYTDEAAAHERRLEAVGERDSTRGMRRELVACRRGRDRG